MKMFVLFFCMIVVFSVSANADEHKKPVEEMPRFSIGTHTKTLLHFDVDIKDAKAALEIWVKEIGKEDDLNIEADIYEDLGSMIKDFQNDKLDLITITSMDYIRLAHEIDAELAFVSLRHGKGARKYLILVREDSPFNEVRDLKDRKLVVLKREEIGLLFMETLLLQNKQTDARKFFSSVQEREKYTRVILPVFFRQADACIAAEGTFKTMAELNPQVGKQLKIIASSEEMIPTVTLYRKDCDEKVKEKTRKRILNLKELVRGRQILMLFKVDGIVPTEESELDTLKILLNEYEDIKAKEGVR